MKLRMLELKDAPFMLEWMHDDSVVYDLKKNFKSMTIKDCELFIEDAKNSKDACHLAIINDTDEYMGTVSLKHIKNKSAEFGIVVRKCAMGKGYSWFGMSEIIEHGKTQLGLNHIYWCVNPNNTRAIKFYDKYRFIKTDAPQGAEGYSELEKMKYIWYEA